MSKEINIFELKTPSKSKPSPQKQSPYLGKKLCLSRLKQIVEALLFSSKTPLSIKKILQAININNKHCTPKHVKKLIASLQEDYAKEERAFQVDEIAEGFILRTKKEFSPYIQVLFQSKNKEKLSPASLEVLAIVAYRQPITRIEIDNIRGVDSSGAVYNLTERSLIEISGTLEAPGRPTLYSTTPLFMQHFGLKSLKELSEHLPFTSK